MADKIPMTPAGLQMLKDELRRRKEVDRFKIVKAIEVAFVKAVEDPEQVKKMNDVGLALKPMVGAEYAKYYAYNIKDIDQNDAEWKSFIDSVVGIMDKDGSARIVIEGSASRVPTKTFGTNEILSNKRMEDARSRLLEAVKGRGKDETKLLLEAVNHLVQGPKYTGDFKNTEKYGKFQYVKLKVR